jgi:Protein of unknown function (DUF1353)
MKQVGKFLTECDLTPLSDGLHWRLKSRLVFRSANIEELISVPSGFVTDLASVPRLFWNILPPFCIAQEACVHDWIYRNHTFSRMVCDVLLYEMMLAERRHWLMRWTIYIGVRLGGWVAWHDERRRIR